MAESPSDYAALLRGVRERENLKLEIHQLQNTLNEAQKRIAELESYTAHLEKNVEERDAALEELRSSVADKNKGLLARVRQQEETIARLQNALQAKHRELEGERSRGGPFKKKQ
ncbi:MAG: hypothetical protein AB1742_09630 [bacterium]